MKETYRDRAKSNLRVAMDIMSLHREDVYNNFAAWHLHKSVELFIKHYLYRDGGILSKSYSISELLELCGAHGVELPICEETSRRLFYAAETLTKMGKDSVYTLDHIVSKSDIDDAIRLLRCMFSESEPKKAPAPKGNIDGMNLG